jgi:hypothetical protein
MVPWYTIEPPTNGLCPTHCRCGVSIWDNDLVPCLDAYYERHCRDITKQVERSEATKESLLEYAAAPYWEGKADELKIPYNLMDLSAPLPPCVSLRVARAIDGMLDDFNDLEEWFFGYKKAPPHEKESILQGYTDGSYTATLKKRRDERDVFLILNETRASAVDPLPIFGPSSKKLKQTTLNQDFHEIPGVEQVLANKTKHQVVIDLTPNPPPSSGAGKRKAIIDLTRNPVKSSVQPPPSSNNQVIGSQSPPENKKKFVVDSPFRTPPQHRKTTM